MQTGRETDRMYPVTIYVVILSINSRVANSFRHNACQTINIALAMIRTLYLQSMDESKTHKVLYLMCYVNI